MPIFDIDNLGECLNCRIPHYSRPELVAALVELFERGDLEATLTHHGRRRSKPFRPNEDEILAGIAGALRISYRLTLQGGERWTQLVGVDWNLWVGDWWSTSRTGVITTASRELTEFLFEREVRQGKARRPGSRKQVRPWNPVYWHEEPVGYEVRYRTSADEATRSDLFPPIRQEIPSNRPKAALAPRRQRAPLPEVRPFRSLTEKQLESRLTRSVLTRLAAATELGRRPDSIPLLIRTMRWRCPAIRFAAARALGRQKVRQAVPALLGALLRHHDVAAADALGRIGDRRALTPLLTLFEWWCGYTMFPEPRFMGAVQRAVVQFGNPAIGRLERLARESPALQDRLFYALSHSRSQRAVEILTQQMPERDYPVVGLLARMGDNARDHLFQVAADETAAVHSRRSAAQALAESAGAFQEKGRRVAETLRDRHKQTHLRARIALLVTGNAQSKVDDPVNALVALLKHPSREKRREAVDRLAELDARTSAREIVELSSDDFWEVRASVARALTRWGEPEEALSRLRRDPDGIVRGYARWFG